MIVDTTAGRIANAAWAHAVATASTGTTAQMFGSQIAHDQYRCRTARRAGRRRPSRPGGLRRNSASARRPAIAIAIRVGIAMIVPTITPLERVEAELVVEVEVEEQRRGEEGEPERGHADQEVVEALDLPQPLERDRQRDRAARRRLGAAPRRAPTASRSGPAAVP